jgi:hypothetical protein
MIVFSVLFIAMLLACVSLVVSGQDLGRQIFLGGVFGLIYLFPTILAFTSNDFVLLREKYTQK